MQSVCLLTVELGGSRSYWNRLLFIDFCSCVLELFSKRYFKTMFFEFILVLAKVWFLYVTDDWTDRWTERQRWIDG